MSRAWESALDRWLRAGLLDADAAARVRAWEQARGGGPRWPVWLALGLGGLTLGAGVLLFVAAHWDALAPGRRFAAVAAALAALHLAAAGLAGRAPALALTLHACGTVALGAAIFLVGQVFHLQEHWPTGLLLWCAGAWIGWWLLRDAAQASLAVLLTPAWLGGEWIAAAGTGRGTPVLAAGLLSLALAYLAAEPDAGPAPRGVRRALVWIGGIGLIPAALFVLASAHEWHRSWDPLSPALLGLGWAIALGLPLAVGWVLRPGRLAPIAAGVAWAAAGVLAGRRGVTPYLWSALLALGLTVWGVLERRAERVNLGIAGFALSVLVYYFSDVMDRLGRSASLIGLGLLFLGGGYLLERARRGLVAGVRESP